MTTTEACPVAPERPTPSEVTRGALAPILVVDDNSAKRLSIRSVLTPLGHPMVEADLLAFARLGRQALSRKLLEPADVARRALELRALRAHPRTEHLPVVILTSSEQESVLIESYRLGTNSYRVKPVDFGDFTQAVTQLGM